MSITIEGVPETITRAQYRHLIESVGFSADDLTELTFSHDGIRATVFALDEQGRRCRDVKDVALHQVFVRVVDPDTPRTPAASCAPVEESPPSAVERPPTRGGGH